MLTVRFHHLLTGVTVAVPPLQTIGVVTSAFVKARAGGWLLIVTMVPNDIQPSEFLDVTVYFPGCNKENIPVGLE